MDVQPRRYRFRVLNASQRPLLTMQLFNQQGVDMHVNGPAGPAIWQIGSDGGFFNNPVRLANPANGNHQCDGTINPPPNNILGGSTDIQAGRQCLFLAPAERADIIIDFGGQAGRTFTMKNFAVIPFPSGGPVGFGAPDATSDGLVMQFRVNQPLQGTDTSFNPAGTHPALRASNMVNIKPANGRGDKLRQLILVEEEGSGLGPDVPGAPDARRRTGGEPDQQHQVERQPRGVDHLRFPARSRTAAASRPRRCRVRARPRSGRSPTSAATLTRSTSTWSSSRSSRASRST